MTRPSVGKGGTDGCFVVEVTNDAEGKERVLARRFKAEAEATDFFTRSVAAHQQKANRERRTYGLFVYETATPKDPKPSRGIDRTFIVPH